MKADVAIAGGGLSGALIAWRLRQARPDLRVAVVERGPALGGNHTWSFHDSDLPPERAAWMAPLVVHHWPRQEVRFPSHERVLETGYNSATSHRLHEVVAPVVGDGLVLGAGVSDVAADGLRLDDGQRVSAGAVIDARGQREAEALTIGYQKFFGQEVRFAEPHGLAAPIIMDATISQADGYRFVYVLPFAEDAALVEDTYYSDGAALDADALRGEIAAYCARAGWRVAEIVREEAGVLPIALAGDIRAHLAASPEGVGVAGLRAGLFHPLTGYSLPDAAALADEVAAAADFSGPAIARLTRGYAERRWRERGYYRLLSRLLYYASTPEGRYKVLGRFYRLSRPLIERFYASRMSAQDKARVLVGKPPVSFRRALECVDEEQWLARCWRPRVAGE
ncbi:MAG: lycopene beta-cyclase CrtY [Parvularculaceae bacterium]